MKKSRAAAEITVDAEKGWTLPTFDSKKPSRFRYWAHVHFERDPAWRHRTWTLLVDLDNEANVSAGQVEATVICKAASAPVSPGAEPPAPTIRRLPARL